MAKRTRHEEQEEAMPKSFDIKSLNDNLLEEVFFRIPDPSSLIRCNSVCKLWSSLTLSNPNFLRRYISHQLSARSAAATPTPFTLLIQTINQRVPIRDGHSPTPDRYRTLFPEPVKVRASFDDLLLLISATVPRAPMRNKKFYVCNHLTGRWLNLPVPTDLPSSEPNIRFCLAGGQKSGDARFRAVLIYLDHALWTRRGSEHKFRASIFRSETGRWSRAVVSSPRKMTAFGFNGNHSAALDGTIYSLDGTETSMGMYVTAFDPFRIVGKKIRCRVIELPCGINTSGNSRGTLCLGVCRGRLRVLQLREERGSRVIGIWELSGGAAAERWELVIRRGFCWPAKAYVSVLGFHPDDGDVVFLLRENHVVVRYNVVVEECMRVCEFGYETTMPNVFQIIHPPWATPVPALLSP